MKFTGSIVSTKIKNLSVGISQILFSFLLMSILKSYFEVNLVCQLKNYFFFYISGQNYHDSS